MPAESDFITSLTNTSAGLSKVGGKGASLARLAATGLLLLLRGMYRVILLRR